VSEKLEETVESLESKEEGLAEIIELAKKDKPKILLVGTHQGASLVMANLLKDIKGTFTETMGKLSVQPHRAYPQKAKKGRSKH